MSIAWREGEVRCDIISFVVVSGGVNNKGLNENKKLTVPLVRWKTDVTRWMKVAFDKLLDVVEMLWNSLNVVVRVAGPASRSVLGSWHKLRKQNGMVTELERLSHLDGRVGETGR